MCSVFFFQAEDGIRDAQESRGLGDVYKRQIAGEFGEILPECVARDGVHPGCRLIENENLRPMAVSYTHLTLPTIYSV